MNTQFIIVMGVAGSGKTTVGKSLSKYLGWDFYDADDFHPPENIAKMTNGIPLNDADRSPWRASLHTLISSSLIQDRPGVLACSALKDSFRQPMVAGNDGAQNPAPVGTKQVIGRSEFGKHDDYHSSARGRLPDAVPTILYDVVWSRIALGRFLSYFTCR